VNTPANPDPSTATSAAGELGRLRDQIDQARAHLAGLQRQIVAAEDQLDNSQQAHLLEANARLLSATLRARTDAETATRALEEMTRASELDALTQLPGPAPLIEHFSHAMASAKRRGTRLALLFLDLNHFKQVNDTLGRTVGDAVLKQVAQRLAASVRETDTVCRYGEDEFLVLLDEVSQTSNVIRVADKSIRALSGPHHVGDTVVRLTASIGISIYPDDGEDAHALISRAEAAMHRAKRRAPGSFPFADHDSTGATAAAGSEAVEAPGPGHPQPPAQSGHELRHAQRDANEQLLVAALGAQELQAAAEAALRRQTEFLAVLAHELRNPLTPIRSATELLGNLHTDEPLLPKLQGVIERQVQQMTRLVNDLLDVSRISSGELQLQRRVIDLGKVVDDALATFLPAMEERRQKVNVRIPEGVLEVLGDAGRLAQVLGNLLDNASKYTPEGGDIGFSLEVINDTVVLAVTDNGIGITAEGLPHVFDAFAQDAHAIGFNGVGLGIGLTVVREVVEAHGGTVIAHSGGSGLGSQFVVTLPLHKSAP
jgi:diguanylate cyclase (GGDEF)-like protein